MANILSFAQKGLIFNSKRDSILVIRYIDSKFQTNKMIGKLGLPGGRIKFGEQPDESFIREVREETGITITPKMPFYTWTWIYNKNEKKKQIVATARFGIYQEGEISPPDDEQETENTLGLATWISLDKVNIDEFVIDEQPILDLYISNKYNFNQLINL